MSDIDITKRLQREKGEEKLIEADLAKGEKAVEDEAMKGRSDMKTVVIMVAVVVGLFIAVFAGFKSFNSITGSSVLSLDEMHVENAQGNLGDEKGYLYNGYSFVRADGLWWTQIEAGDRLISIPLHFGPKDVEDIVIEGSVSDAFNTGDVYIAIDPDVVNQYYTLGVSELSLNTAQGILRRPVAACTKEAEVCTGRPVLSGEDLVKKVDRVLYKWYGIMP